MQKRIKQFGGDKRVFLEDQEFNNIADTSIRRISDDAEEVIDTIKEGLKTLTDQQRLVIATLCETDPTTDEMYTEERAAIVLKMPLGTLKSHYNRAKKKLRKLVTQNASSSIYIESMLRGGRNDKAKTEFDNDADE